MSVTACSPELRNVRGELRLRFDTDANGDTIPSERFRRGLYHFSKPYREGSRLCLQVLNPTAGLFAGDHLESEVTVENGAQVSLLAPSSTQVYTMSNGGWASVDQRFRVGRHSSLVFQPRWSVLHRGACFRQKTRIDLEASASLLFIEQFAAGRKAHGEFLEFEQLQNDLTVYRAKRLVLKERSSCGQSERTGFWNQRGEPRAYYTTALVACPDAELDSSACVRALEAAKDAHTGFGLTELETGLFALRILSSSNCMISPLLSIFCSFLPSALSLSYLSQRIH